MKLNILILDDNPQFLTALSFLLQEAIPDFINHINISSSSDKALEYMQNNRVDLMFIDYEMPDSNGDKLIRIVRNSNRFIKIIAVSYHTDFEAIEAMILAGSNTYISKDEINKDLLKKSIYSLINN